MDLLSKKELEEEIQAVKDVINIHITGIELNQQGKKVNEFLLKLLERELKSISRK